MRPSPPVPRPLILTARASAGVLLVGLLGLTPLTSRGGIIITIDGKSTGKAEAGPHPKGGMSSDVAVEGQREYIKRYEGPTQFVADYDIALTADGKLDKTKTNTVTFKTVNYTSSGVLKTSSFTTQPITVTDVAVDKDGKLESFKFDSKNWYDPKSGYANSLTDNGLAGMLNVVTGDSSYVASYIIKSNGVVSTYTITGTKAKDKPFPDPTFGHNAYEMFSPVPEPTTLVLMATGAVGLIGCRLGRARSRTPPGRPAA